MGACVDIEGVCGVILASPGDKNTLTDGWIEVARVRNAYY